jgi:hydroxypyruvate isomerase
MKYSANLGFLFNEFTLPDAVRESAKAGFDAVELHWPYAVDPVLVRAALDETGLPLLALNVGPVNRERGEFGVAAIPGRGDEARRAIDQAIAYAVVTGARSIHVTAGRAEGDVALATFVENLRYADAAIGARAIGILIEPLNHRDAPGYYLRTLEDAFRVQDAAAIDRVKVMFDCYHVQIESGDLLRRAEANLDRIGHIQFAAVPDRGEPDQGEIAYDRLLPAIVAAGYSGWFGAEYRPRATTAEGLGWLGAFTA